MEGFFLIVKVGFYFHSSVFTHFVTTSHVAWPPLCFEMPHQTVILVLQSYLVICLLCLYFTFPDVNTDVPMQA